MSALGLSPGGRVAGIGPLLARVIVGVIMVAHGWQKFTMMGIGGFTGYLESLSVPLPGLTAVVVSLVELGGGILLILGLLSRLAALLLTVDLAVATLLVKLQVGLIAPEGQGAGAELDLALIAGFLVVFFSGPGALALDRAFGVEASPRSRGARGMA